MDEIKNKLNILEEKTQNISKYKIGNIEKIIKNEKEEVIELINELIKLKKINQNNKKDIINFLNIHLNDIDF